MTEALSTEGQSALERGDMIALRQLAAARVGQATGKAEGHFLLGIADSE